MKKINVIFIILLMINKLFSQSNITDSLALTLKSHKQDTNEVNTLNKLSELSWEVGNNDTSIYYAKAALKLATKLQFQNGISTSYMNLGSAFSGKGNYAEGIKHGRLALKIFEKSNDKQAIAACYTNIGVAFGDQGNYPEALKNYLAALKISLEAGDKKTIANVYQNIAGNYLREGNLDDAAKNFDNALKIYEEIKYKKGIAACNTNMAMLYTQEGNYDEALKKFQESLKCFEELGDFYGVDICYSGIGNLYFTRKNFPGALKNYLAGLEVAQNGNETSQAFYYNNIGAVYTELNQPKKAKEYIRKALELNMKNRSLEYIIHNYESLAVADSLLGDYKNALRHYRLAIIYRDSVINEENTRKTIELSLKYEFGKKAAADSIKVIEEKKVVAAQLKQEKTQRFALYGGLGLVIVFACFMANRFHITKKQKRIIEVKELETQKQNAIISQQKHLVEEKHKEITDSINYAERIQRSFLATKELLDENLKDYFVLFRPKDVVSGDFYWASKLQNGCFMLATADSTGHGVPGAIMSLLNITSLEKAIEKTDDPAEILNLTRQTIIQRLKKDGSAEGGKDGMDCSLITFDFKNSKLLIAAANNPVWIIRNGELIEIRPDKIPVGKHDRDQEPFTLHTFNFEKEDTIYTLTDGFPDQFGGPQGKKFMSKKLKELLCSIAHVPLDEQKNILETTLQNWIGNIEQVDDITLIAVKL